MFEMQPHVGSVVVPFCSDDDFEAWKGFSQPYQSDYRITLLPNMASILRRRLTKGEMRSEPEATSVHEGAQDGEQQNRKQRMGRIYRHMMVYRHASMEREEQKRKDAKALRAIDDKQQQAGKTAPPLSQTETERPLDDVSESGEDYRTAEDETRQKNGEAVIPSLGAPLHDSEKEATSGEQIVFEQVTNAFGYAPRRVPFTNEDHRLFLLCLLPRGELPEYANQKFNNIETLLPNRSREEILAHYYQWKRLDATTSPYGSLPWKKWKEILCRIRRGLGWKTSAKKSTKKSPKKLPKKSPKKSPKISPKTSPKTSPKKSPKTPVMQVSTTSRLGRPLFPSAKKALDQPSDALVDPTSSGSTSPRKRKASDDSSHTTSAKRSKPKEEALEQAAPAQTAAPKPPPRKRKIAETDFVETDPANAKARKAANEGDPKNIDEAVLKIIKKRFIEARKAGKTGDEFVAHFLGMDIKLPALIPYHDRPNDSKLPKGVVEQIRISKENFELAQQCLILTWYLVQEQRRRVEPNTRKNWGTSQWQHCAIGDANKMGDIGRKMESKEIFMKTWCPALYDQKRIDRDLEALADWEDSNRPAGGWWPDLKKSWYKTDLPIVRRRADMPRAENAPASALHDSQQTTPPTAVMPTSVPDSLPALSSGPTTGEMAPLRTPEEGISEPEDPRLVLEPEDSATATVPLFSNQLATESGNFEHLESNDPDATKGATILCEMSRNIAQTPAQPRLVVVLKIRGVLLSTMQQSHHDHLMAQMHDFHQHLDSARSEHKEQARQRAEDAVAYTTKHHTLEPDYFDYLEHNESNSMSQWTTLSYDMCWEVAHVRAQLRCKYEEILKNCERIPPDELPAELKQELNSLRVRLADRSRGNA